MRLYNQLFSKLSSIIQDSSRIPQTASLKIMIKLNQQPKPSNYGQAFTVQSLLYLTPGVPDKICFQFYNDYFKVVCLKDCLFKWPWS